MKTEEVKAENAKAEEVKLEEMKTGQVNTEEVKADNTEAGGKKASSEIKESGGSSKDTEDETEVGDEDEIIVKDFPGLHQDSNTQPASEDDTELPDDEDSESNDKQTEIKDDNKKSETSADEKVSDVEKTQDPLKNEEEIRFKGDDSNLKKEELQKAVPQDKEGTQEFQINPTVSLTVNDGEGKTVPSSTVEPSFPAEAKTTMDSQRPDGGVTPSLQVPSSAVDTETKPTVAEVKPNEVMEGFTMIDGTPFPLDMFEENPQTTSSSSETTMVQGTKVDQVPSASVSDSMPKSENVPNQEEQKHGKEEMQNFEKDGQTVHKVDESIKEPIKQDQDMNIGKERIDLSRTQQSTDQTINIQPITQQNTEQVQSDQPITQQNTEQVQSDQPITQEKKENDVNVQPIMQQNREQAVQPNTQKNEAHDVKPITQQGKAQDLNFQPITQQNKEKDVNFQPITQQNKEQGSNVLEMSQQKAGLEKKPTENQVPQNQQMDSSVKQDKVEEKQQNNMQTEAPEEVLKRNEQKEMGGTPSEQKADAPQDDSQNIERKENTQQVPAHEETMQNELPHQEKEQTSNKFSDSVQTNQVNAQKQVIDNEQQAQQKLSEKLESKEAEKFATPEQTVNENKIKDTQDASLDGGKQAEGVTNQQDEVGQEKNLPEKENADVVTKSPSTQSLPPHNTMQNPKQAEQVNTKGERQNSFEQPNPGTQNPLQPRQPDVVTDTPKQTEETNKIEEKILVPQPDKMKIDAIPAVVNPSIMPSSVAEQLQSSMEDVQSKPHTGSIEEQRATGAPVNQSVTLPLSENEAPQPHVQDPYATQDFLSRRVLSHETDMPSSSIHTDKRETEVKDTIQQPVPPEGQTPGQVNPEHVVSQNQPLEGSTVSPVSNDVPPPPTEKPVTDAGSTITTGAYDIDGQWSRKINDEGLGEKEDLAYQADQPWNKLTVLTENQLKLIIQKLPPSMQSFLEQEPFGLSPHWTVLMMMCTFLCMFGATCITCLCQGRGKPKKKDPVLVVRGLEEQLFVVTKEKENLEDEVQSLTQKLENIEQDYVSQQSSAGTIQTDLQTYKLHNDALKQTVQEQKEELSELQKQVTQKNKDVKAKDNQLKSTQEQIQQKEKKITDISSKLKEANKENQDKNGELKSLKSETKSLENRIEQLETSKSQLTEEVDVWSEKVKSMTEQLDYAKSEQKQMADDLGLKENELEVLRDCFLQLKAFENEDGEEGEDSQKIEEKLKSMMEVSRVSAMVRSLEEETSNLQTKLDIEMQGRRDLEEKILDLERKSENLQSDKMRSDRQHQEAQTKLEVLSNYFKQKELEMQRELGEHEALKKEKDSKLENADVRSKMIQEELEAYRSQVDDLKREITSAERDFRAQIAANEKKAHENWLAARAAERELKESRHESSVLRQKLTDLERRLMQGPPSNVIRPLPTRGMPPPGMMNGPPPPGYDRPLSRGMLPPQNIRDEDMTATPGPDRVLSPDRRMDEPPEGHPADRRHPPPFGSRMPPPPLDARSPPPYDRRHMPPMDRRFRHTPLPPPNLSRPRTKATKSSLTKNGN